jgi:hypothetical protein
MYRVKGFSYELLAVSFEKSGCKLPASSCKPERRESSRLGALAVKSYDT